MNTEISAQRSNYEELYNNKLLLDKRLNEYELKYNVLEMKCIEYEGKIEILNRNLELKDVETDNLSSMLSSYKDSIKKTETKLVNNDNRTRELEDLNNNLLKNINEYRDEIQVLRNEMNKSKDNDNK